MTKKEQAQGPMFQRNSRYFSEASENPLAVQPPYELVKSPAALLTAARTRLLAEDCLGVVA